MLIKNFENGITVFRPEGGMSAFSLLADGVKYMGFGTDSDCLSTILDYIHKTKNKDNISLAWVDLDVNTVNPDNGHLIEEGDVIVSVYAKSKIEPGESRILGNWPKAEARIQDALNISESPIKDYNISDTLISDYDDSESTVMVAVEYRYDKAKLNTAKLKTSNLVAEELVDILMEGDINKFLPSGMEIIGCGVEKEHVEPDETGEGYDASTEDACRLWVEVTYDPNKLSKDEAMEEVIDVLSNDKLINDYRGYESVHWCGDYKITDQKI